jgi:SNF2 family DNA or RNA helicase
VTVINFAYIQVEPTPICDFVWEQAFFNYLLNRKQFPIDIAKQESLLTTLAGDIGLNSPDTPKILEALHQRVKPLRRWYGLQKVPNVLKAIEAELKADAHKIVVLANSGPVLSELRDGLGAYGSVILYPGTPIEKRGAVCQRFQNQARCRVLVCDIAAAGTALDLTAAERVHVVEGSWFADNNVQAIMRVANWRQQYDVEVRFYGLANTIDDKIQRMLCSNTKRRVIEFVAQAQQSATVGTIYPT